ncbi:MAG TPA: hypothetical protein VJV78_29715 [Polyangiales bacterium]|nr:hypothetical protein [Polyangiales bacterium]
MFAACGRVGFQLKPAPDGNALQGDGGVAGSGGGGANPDGGGTGGSGGSSGSGGMPDTAGDGSIDPDLDAAPGDAAIDGGISDGGMDAAMDAGCPTTCTNDHGTADCSTGQCQVSCAIGYADCDGLVQNGCEQSTTNDLMSCGSCDFECTTSQGSTSCSQGVCMPSCSPGVSGDCDGNTQNGCETNLTTATLSCGSCGTACTNAHGTTSCVAGVCTPVCANGYADCDGDKLNGCETRIDTDPANCGACGTMCNTSFQVCANRACQVSTCPAGTADCDANMSDCETNTLTTVSDCGFCDNACTTANGTPRCTSGSCAISSCNSGYANCDSNVANGCEVALATNVSNCGSCGTACTNAHGTTSCSANACVPVCSSGWGNCDSNVRNGCETAVNTLTNCGGCGNVCPNAMSGATAVCNSGVCGYTCNSMSGVYALRINTSVSWPATSYVRSGSGTASFWLRLTITQSGTSLTGTAALCDQSTPETRNSITTDRYLLDYPDVMFTPGATPASFSATLASQSPGAALTSTRTAHLLGMTMSDPLNGAWPSVSTARANQVDHDSDGEVGISVVFIDDSTYNHAQTDGTLWAARASLAYGVQRLRFSLGGALSGCSGASGTATVQSFDTRAIGCRLESGSDCSSSQYNHIDSNSAVYTTGSANYTLTRLGASGSTFTCAQVRTAL